MPSMHVVLANFAGLNAFGIITSKKRIPCGDKLLSVSRR
jgi:hypothetical protein